MSSQAELELECYSNDIATAYVQLRRRYRPEFRYLSRDNREKIRKLAELLWTNKINPWNYVRFTFDYYATYTSDVYIGMLTSPKTVQAYVDSRPETMESLRRTVSLQRDLVTGEVSRGRSMRDILTDYSLGLSAIFRYALAWTVGADDLCVLFRQDAEKMLLFEPLYRDLLKNMLPEEYTRGQPSIAEPAGHVVSPLSPLPSDDFKSTGPAKT